MTQKTNQNLGILDVRVRERNLRSGLVNEKDVEKYLSALPDLAGEVESFSTAQPALAQPATDDLDLDGDDEGDNSEDSEDSDEEEES